MRGTIMTLHRYCIENELPSLLAEYAKDNPIPSDEIGFKSTTECKWICRHGHIEYESPYKRVRRGYCKTCGKDCAGSLGQKHPELIKYWSPANSKTAFEISPRSSVPHLWCCEHGHQWERTIAGQLAAVSPCPYCKSSENSLFKFRPELLKEWDYEQNDIEPDFVSYMSNIQYNWICSQGHQFKASPAERMRRNKGCTVCKSILVKRPDIALEWHPIKNSIKPEDITPASHKEVWFICRNCGEEYISEVVDRCRRKGPNCPYCR